MRRGTMIGKTGEMSPKNEIEKTSYQNAMRHNFGKTESAKKITLPSEESKKLSKGDVKLDSPTSTDMQRSLLIASADPSFDFMTQLKRKKNNFGFGGTQYNAFGLNMALSQKGKLRVPGIRPNPRDGHSVV